ncbi:MAG: hypothetical protein ABI114_11915 [Rhodanobacter sp.]
MKFLPILLCTGTLLAACSNKPPEPIAAPTARVATPFDALRADEQRARDVQKTIDANAEKQRKQIEAAAQ